MSRASTIRAYSAGVAFLSSLVACGGGDGPSGSEAPSPMTETGTVRLMVAQQQIEGRFALDIPGEMPDKWCAMSIITVAVGSRARTIVFHPSPLPGSSCRDTTVLVENVPVGAHLARVLPIGGNCVPTQSEQVTVVSGQTADATVGLQCPETDGMLRFAMNDSIADQFQLGGATRTVTKGRDSYPVVSPDGGTILFTRDVGGDPDLWIANPGGELNEINRVAPAIPFESSPGVEDAATWSPDGWWIAFQTDRDGDFEIYAKKVDGTELRRLTEDPAGDIHPSWSPDGNQLAFASDRAGSLDIYVMNADGSGVTRLTDHPGPDDYPRWSVDGSRIAFSSERNGNEDIYLMDADGSGLVRVTTDPARDWDAEWTLEHPVRGEEARIAFTSDREGEPAIWAVLLDGTDPLRLSPAGRVAQHAVVERGR